MNKVYGGKDWWWEKLSLVLVGKAVLSKSLTQFLADGGAVLPPCSLALLQLELLSPWQVTTDLCLSRRHSSTQRQVWLSLLWGSPLLSLSPGAHKELPK